MTVTELPQVHECTVAGCSYNHDTACHAGAINVTGSHAGCGTFIELGSHGELTQNVAFVGACHSPTAPTTRVWSATPSTSGSASARTRPTA